MSLNGLDVPAINDAYQTAIIEPGGWFLLKYTSRDSVDLWGRGKNGVHEARTSIAKYEEPSPLYGLIIYRRRKVLIKYIPDGTSRLLQARTAVHFQDVAERYAPYETLLEITSAEGLNDTSLAASFPLHTASPSTSSNRLHEISEDAEDGGATPRRPANPATSTGQIFGTQRYKMERRVDQLMRSDRPLPSIKIHPDPRASLPPPVSPSKTLSSQFLVRDDSGQRSITSLGTPPSMASIAGNMSSTPPEKDSDSSRTTPHPVTSPEQPTHPVQARAAELSDSQKPPSFAPSDPPNVAISAPEQRLSGSSDLPAERPLTAERVNLSEDRKYDDDPYDFSKFDLKPKVKLGPRPVADGEKTKRPTVASVSAVPPSYRPTQKKAEPTRPMSQGPMNLAAPGIDYMRALPPPPPIPDAPEYSPRPISRGSVKSTPSHKSTAMTPDKVRLMKAVELRKKQLRKSTSQQESLSQPKDEKPVTASVSPNESITPKALERELVTNETLQSIANKADSGIEMNYGQSDRQSEEKRREEATSDPPQSSQQDIQPRLLPSNSSISKESDPETPIPAPLPDAPDDTAKPRSTHEDPVTDDSTLEKLNGNVAESIGPGLLNLTSIPATVPSIVLAGGSRPNSSSEQQTGPGANPETESTASSDAPEVPQRNPRRQNDDLAKRRRGIVEPLQTDLDAANMSSDEEFMEELQSATVQEAKPLAIPNSQSPGRRPSATSMRSVPSVKSINIPHRASFATAEKSPEGSTTDLSLERPNPPLPTPPVERYDPSIALTRAVSAGISKRIQTLTELSSREGSPSAGHEPMIRPLTPDQLRQEALQRDAKRSVYSPPPKARTSSFQRQNGRASGYPQPGPASQTNGAQRGEAAPVWTVQHGSTANRDSVSVSARIVRPSIPSETDNVAQPEGALQQSQYMINHNRSSGPQRPVKLPPLVSDSDRRVAEAATSLASSPAQSPTLTHNSSIDQRGMSMAHSQSYSRHGKSSQPASPSHDEVQNLPMHMGTTAASRTSFMNWDDEPVVPKDGSRTSRFFKRMSNLGSSKRKSVTVTAPPPQPPSIPSLTSNPDLVSSYAPRASVTSGDRSSDLPPAVMVGDLNIQFPDSLLWKRRIVEIDRAGYLAFSVPQALDIQKGVARKFHMNQIRMPYTPDVDRQELPHSISLDFLDGTTLQAACEDSMTHRQVLHVLRSYWKTWANA